MIFHPDITRALALERQHRMLAAAARVRVLVGAYEVDDARPRFLRGLIEGAGRRVAVVAAGRRLLRTVLSQRP